MAKIDRYNGDLQAFASAAPGTERTIFGDVTQANDLTSQISADFLRGWGIVGPSDQPALEDFNGAMYTHGQLLAYLHQMGIAEYNATQEYHVGSLCNVSGVVYSSLINTNIGNTPSSSPASWSKLSSGQLIGVRVFTTVGASVYTPTAGTASVIVEVLSGGGAGGGAPATAAGQVSVATGGASGSYGKSRITSGFAGVTVTVGAGGVPVSGGIGGSGGASSFGALLTAPGGVGGGIAGPSSPPYPSAGLTPGSASSGGNIVNSGGNPPGVAFASATSSFSGSPGASSVFGGGGGVGVVGGAGVSASGKGSGGGGTSQTVSGAALLGGAGGTGIVIVYEYS